MEDQKISETIRCQDLTGAVTQIDVWFRENFQTHTSQNPDSLLIPLIGPKKGLTLERQLFELLCSCYGFDQEVTSQIQFPSLTDLSLTQSSLPTKTEKDLANGRGVCAISFIVGAEITPRRKFAGETGYYEHEFQIKTIKAPKNYPQYDFTRRLTLIKKPKPIRTTADASIARALERTRRSIAKPMQGGAPGLKSQK